MIDLYFWPTPNGFKILLFLEEVGLRYRIIPVNISTGAQFDPAFLKISPNNKMPAVIDHAPADGGAAVSVFESGAILLYLAEKTGQFLSSDARVRLETMEWLFWQMAGFGPMLGQNHHFSLYAPEKIPYAIKRYQDETTRLYGVLDKRLASNGGWLAGSDYSIADMAAFPWTKTWKAQSINLDQFPHVAKWRDAIIARPATQRAYTHDK
ncbi:glutathione binding-like protein [Candidatus Kirkpatrickella diaphorinae]|uniref:Glutathione binding-like protein n=1 Tax=Candidatus Kirkpatrickella diaphorinae TaxID=2984322 RepID=A0ABY6GKX3_9PROT|nr:glutathione binding-like protein [Candidatus Kirkpatrickella diaphorinae]UYH51914.1 glutathione binding-like protein [Candidatus Kirkpatrickella diaphorinae]